MQFLFDSIFRLGTLSAVIDIFIVALVLYWIMATVKGTRAERMLWGVVVIVIVYFVSLRAGLVTLHWILNNFLGSIVIFIIVVFQQDIRRALGHMGRHFSTTETARSREVLDEIAEAVSSMSGNRTGGLIVIERSVDLGGFLDTGVDMDAKVSKELILSVFNGQSPMHDGAAVVRGARILKAGCILPLTEKDLAGSLGTRHRAAMGLAEETDAAIIVVSEKTGDIALAVDDEALVGLRPSELLDRLKLLFPAEINQRSAFFPWKAGA